MSSRTVDRIRGWIAIAGLVLGIFAVGFSLRANSQANAATSEALNSSITQTCERQHAAAAQWDSVIAVIEQLDEKALPGSTNNPAFKEFVDRTHKIYASFPACKNLNYDPVTGKASTK
jgi:hypothetical protein